MTRIPEELPDAIEGLVTSAEKAGMPQHGVQIFRHLVTEWKDVFRLKLGADSPANVKALVIKLRKDAELLQITVPKYASPQSRFMRDKIASLKSWAWYTRTPEKSGRVLFSPCRSLGPTSIARLSICVFRIRHQADSMAHA
jgi:hypothetical protein